MRTLLFFAIFQSVLLFAKEPEHLDFVIAVASYNNAPWVKENLDSIYSQELPKNCTCEVYYMNDASTDGTGALVDAYFQKHHVPNTWHVIHNKERKMQLANYYTLIHSLDPKKIVLIVDGDDFLAHKRVLKALAKVYRATINGKRIWMTYGNYHRTCDGKKQKSVCEKIPSEVLRTNSFRSFRFVASHLRTFYAGLYQKIKKEDLMWKGKFLPMATDVATETPMMEMSSKGHIYRFTEVLYIYRTENPLSFFNKGEKERDMIKAHIYSLPPYTPLAAL